MRIALILLSIVALLFIGTISWYLMKSDGTWLTASQNTHQNAGIDIETLRYQIKTEEKIKALETTVNELSGKNRTHSAQEPMMNTNTGKTVVKVSGKFLAQVMPAVTLSLTENTGIFGLYTFDTNTAYSTYEDTKLGMRVIASPIGYDAFLKNMRAIGKEVYSVNEAKGFTSRAFYLNPPKTDTTVRLVLESESQSIALEIPKSTFPILKKLLSKKK